MIGLYVLVGFVIYLCLIAAAVALVIWCVSRFSATAKFALPLSIGIVAAAFLLPNRNWERIVAAFHLPQLCKESGHKTVSGKAAGVDGIVFNYKPDETNLWFDGYSYGEWKDTSGLWRIDAHPTRPGKEPYKVSEFTARYAADIKFNEHVKWGIRKNEVTITDRTSGKVLAQEREFYYPSGGQALQNVLSDVTAPLSWMIPLRDCKRYWLDPPLLGHVLLPPNGRRPLGTKKAP